MKLSIKPLVFEIENASGDTVATVTRLANGAWCFRNARDQWVEECFKGLSQDELLAEYLVIRKRRNAIRKAVKESARKRK